MGAGVPVPDELPDKGQCPCGGWRWPWPLAAAGRLPAGSWVLVAVPPPPQQPGLGRAVRTRAGCPASDGRRALPGRGWGERAEEGAAGDRGALCPLLQGWHPWVRTVTAGNAGCLPCLGERRLPALTGDSLLQARPCRLAAGAPRWVPSSHRPGSAQTLYPSGRPAPRSGLCCGMEEGQICCDHSRLYEVSKHTIVFPSWKVFLSEKIKSAFISLLPAG